MEQEYKEKPIKCELYHDNFQNFKQYNIPKAQLVIADMAKTQKRVTAKEKETNNQKYAFRCFLLRLGFIGAEYKETRKILLRNLEGNGSFKSGSPKVRELVERIG